MEDINAALKLLATETADLYAPTVIQTISHIPSSLEFLRNWVTPNVPLLIKGGAKDWPALHKWNPKYLTEQSGNKKVTVAVTPTGYADAIDVDSEREEIFVLPEERSITLSDLFTKLAGGTVFDDPAVGHSKGIFYLQKQDSNLTKEFSELLPDIDQKLNWASGAFASPCSAINLWIGDARSVTSLHKDPFENIYCVVSGHKDFILFPPTDRPWLPYTTLPVGEYKEVRPGEFVIERKASDQAEKDEGSNFVPWINLNPLEPDLQANPSYVNAHPLHVRVKAGDLLYLPALWFHHVSQSDGCIAVNYWFDMAMDVKFVYFQFLEHLVKARDERQGKSVNQ